MTRPNRASSIHGRLLLVASAILILSPAARATIRLVPGEYATIQTAIDAATAGDEVVIADGVYAGIGNKDLDFAGKAITVRSASGDPNTCIIDCEGSGRGFYFHTGETAASVVHDLTIRGANNSAVYCSSSSPTLTKCAFLGNTTQNYGGGVYCSNSIPRLTNCTIAGNTARYGGGVYCDQSSPTLINCTISGNAATSGGGGGVNCSSSSSPTLTNCKITGNAATDSLGSGGGLLCSYSSPTLANCTITENTAHSGGGVYCSHGSPTLTNCTIMANSATPGGGGGVYCYYSNPALTNCILWGDTHPEIDVFSGSPAVTYSDIQGGWTGTGNIDADPLFSFPADRRLLPDSPCIDTGTNTPPGGLASLDADGAPRLVDGDGDGAAVTDMGVYEFDPTSPTLALSTTLVELYVPEGFSDTRTLGIRNSSLGALDWEVQWEAGWLSVEPGCGTSSGEVDDVALNFDTAGLPYGGTYRTTLSVIAPAAFNAPRGIEVVLHVSRIRLVPGDYATIQAAIDSATAGDEVVIAEGVYAGAGNKDLDFTGKAITVRSASDDPNTCVVECAGSGRGFYFHTAESAASVVQGLTIRGASDSGVYCSHSSPTLANCAVTGGTANFGGGVYCEYSSPSLTNCIIVANKAKSGGGGVYCSSSSRPMLTDCAIADNTAPDSLGGGLYLVQSSPTLTNCNIAGNTARSDGGGLYCYYYSGPILANCTITSNTARSGGGMFCSTASPKLTNCTITGNVAWASSAGGVYCSSSSPMLTNCILWGDAPEEINVASGNPIVTSCDVQGGWPGIGNIDVDPLLAFPADGHLLPGSPCIDAGTNTPPGGITPLDPDGVPRPTDGDEDGAAVADMGVYEFTPATPTLALSTSLIDVRVFDGLSATRTIRVRNSGVGTLAWELEWDADWLSADQTSGSSSGEVNDVTLTFDTSGLALGTYSTALRVIAPDAFNAPRIVKVILRVSRTRLVPSQYATIQAAIDAAIAGDEVVIADGVHTGFGNKNLEFAGKAITVRSASNNPNTCVIDCQGSGRGSFFHSGETAESVLQGLTVRNGNAGGVYCYYSSNPTLLNCAIAGNSGYYAGGVFCSSASPTLIGCTVTGNTGTGVACSSGSPTLTNCTITSNTGAGVLGEISSSPTLTNCILWGNTWVEFWVWSGSPTVTHCDVQGGWPGAGNIDLDPLFVDPDGPDNDPNTWADNDYRLMPGSPCIDAGLNSAVPAGVLTDLAGAPRFVDDPNTPDCQWSPGDCGDAPIVDIGAYEFQPAGPAPCIGDLNCDGSIDFADIDPFVLALSGEQAYVAQFPNCRWLNADANGDSAVDFADIDAFVSVLFTQCP